MNNLRRDLMIFKMSEDFSRFSEDFRRCSEDFRLASTSIDALSIYKIVQYIARLKTSNIQTGHF